MTTAYYAERSLGQVARDAFDDPAGLVSRLSRAWTRHLAYRRALAELKTQTGRELADHDLGAAELTRLARDAARKN